MFLSGRVCARRREIERRVMSLSKRVWVSERQRENTRFRLNACDSVRQREYAFLSMFVCLSSSEECVFLSERVCGYLQEGESTCLFLNMCSCVRGNGFPFECLCICKAERVCVSVVMCVYL